MKLLVIGAAGRTGQAIVEQALALGHQVTAFVHDREHYKEPAGLERVVAGDIQNPTMVAKAMEGQEAVLDALGGHLPFLNTTLETDSARIVLDCMRATGVRRLIIVSTIGEGHSIANVHSFYKHLIMPTFLRGAMKDKAGMEAVVEESDLDWIIVRPAGLTNGEAKGDIRIVDPESAEKVSFITRADVAAFMLQQLTSTQYLHQAVGIANP